MTTSNLLAAIAAADAICCAHLGRRSRGQDYREAVALLEQVDPNGEAHARDLDLALAAKELVHYGTDLFSPARHQSLFARRAAAGEGRISSNVILLTSRAHQTSTPSSAWEVTTVARTREPGTSRTHGSWVAPQ